MPRLPRDFAVGEIYHLINRGVNRSVIFSKAQDYSRFIISLELFNAVEPVNIWHLLFSSPAGTDLARRLKEERGKLREPIVELMAFSLMPNHFHLLAREIIDNGISLFMRKLGGYAVYYNKQHNRIGPLFQSRYKAIRQESEIQLANTFTYIHTNAVELVEPEWKDEFEVKDLAGALEFLRSYRWSSYQDYLGIGHYGQVTQRDFFLDYFRGPGGCRAAVEDWVKFKAAKFVRDYKRMI